MDETVNEVITGEKPLTGAVGYIRVSGKAQGEGDGPVRQRAGIEEFSSRSGLRLLQCFSDLGVSGTIEGLDRPALVQMLTFMQEFGVGVLIVERMDRLARDLMVSELLIRELRTRGIKLYSVEQGMVDLCTNASDPGRVFVRQVFGAVAEYEKSALVLKLRAARDRIRRASGRCEGIRPYGHTRQELLTLETIRQMREGVNASWGAIARSLIAAGFTKRNQKKNWTGPDVRDLLVNWTRRKKKYREEEDAKRAAIAARARSRRASSRPLFPPSGEADSGCVSIGFEGQLRSAQGLSPASSGMAESSAE
jgi:DNA invertase Pin-like site-specific DNA recombinase